MIYVLFPRMKIYLETSYINGRSYTILDELAFRHDIKGLPWVLIYETINADHAANMLTNMILNVADHYAPQDQRSV